jgi:hypothetical protein
VRKSILLEGTQAIPVRPSDGRAANTRRGVETGPYLKENTVRLHDDDQLGNAVKGNNGCLF